MPIIEGPKLTADSPFNRGSERIIVGLYDFATDGGAVGDITLRGPTIPNGAIVTDALIEVDTVLTSGGAATVAVKVEGAADVQGAAPITGAPWATTGRKRAGALTATTAPLKTTAARSVVATVATAALTAGVFQVIVKYLEFGN